MIATEILTRYQAGDGFLTLMRAYHIGQPTLRRLLITMGATIRPHGQHGRPSAYQSSSVAQRDIENHHGDPQYCKRCEILLRFDPGQHGYCRECLQHLHPLDAHQACT